MTKKVITLSLGDLKDLGIIPRKSKRKRRSKRRKVYIDAKTGAIIGGPKSDSSHMQGFGITSSNPTQFLNSSNLNTEIQQANLEAIKNRSNPLTITDGTPDRFDKDIVDRSFTRLMLPYIQRQAEETNKIKGVLNSGIADYYDFKEQYQNDRPNRIEELVNYDDNDGIVDPTLEDDNFVGGGLNKNYDTEARYAQSEPAQLRAGWPSEPQLDIQSEINEERFNPLLPMDEVEEPVVIRRGRQRQTKEKQKDRKTIFGIVKNAMFSGGKDEKIAPFVNEEDSNPIIDLAELRASQDATPKSALKSPPPLVISQQASATKTPEEIKASKALVTNNQTNRVPKGLSVKEAKELYKYYGGENEYVDNMTNINAIWKQIREQKKKTNNNI
jgi:hypothetical protein